MQHSLRIGKRALTVAVATLTAFWSIGFSAFVAPLTAHAAVAGDLIKGTTLSTVYYLGSDGSRYAFPNEKTYFSWYTDFSGVQVMSDSALAAIPLAGNIVYRPGSFWIKIQSDPKTYAVTPQGQIRWIETEAVAVGLAGANWNQFIQDVPDVFFVDYNVGTSLTTAANAYNGALVTSGGNNYLIWNGQKRLITSAGFTANRFQARFLLDGSGINLAGIPSGADVTGAEAALRDTAQLGGGVTGGLSVSLASDTPASATIPAGAASVEFAKYRLVANTGSANVSQVTLTLGGIGATSNIENVYLYNGNTRLTDGRSVNSSTRKVTFSGLNLSLSSGAAITLVVRADISATPTGGDTANFSIASAGDITSTATVSGNFPVTGNTMTFSATLAGTVTIDATGSIANPTIGQEGAVIAKFSVDADGEDATLKQITVNVDDAGDHSNYKLWDGTTLLATGTQSDDLVTFVLTNQLVIEDGDSENLEVSADIGGEAADTIKVAIEEEADVSAMGGDFGFNMAVVITGYDETGALCASSADDCSFSTIQGGELTFAFNGPAADDIQIDGKDQVMMRFSVTAEEMTTIKEIGVIVACEVSAGASICDDDDTDDGDLKQIDEELNLQDVTIRTSSGTAWMGPEELSGADASSDITQTLTFTDDQVMNAGQTLDLMITVDVDSGAEEGDIFNVTLDMSTVTAEDANGDDLAAGDIVPTADLVGNDMTLTDASLDIEVSQPPTSGTYVKGTAAVPVVGFNFDAGDASDVTVTDLTVDVDGDTDGATAVTDNLASENFISSCSAYDSESGALIDGPESIEAATESILFENFAWAIPAGETKKMIIKCNLANVDTDSGTDDIYEFRIDAAGSVTAEDADGDSVTPTLVDGNGAGDTEITVTGAGDISVAIDGGTANSTIILGESTGVAMSKFRFDASDEAFTVTELELNNVPNGVLATGTVTLAGLDDGDTLVINGVTYTAEDTLADVDADEFHTGGATDTTDATALAAAINDSTTVGTVADGVFATSSAAVVTVNAVSPGTAGNAITTVAGTCANGSECTFSGATLASGAAGTGADDIAAAVKISYLNQAGATVVKTGFLSGGVVHFSSLDFYVPVDAVRVLTVTVDTGTVSSTGATSGDLIQLNLDLANAGSFEAVGAGSGETLNEDTDPAYVMANDMQVRKTKPTISLASGSPSGASVPGLSEVFRFNVAADSRGFVVLSEILFKLTATDNATTLWNDCGTGTRDAASAWKFHELNQTELLDDDTDWAFLDNAGGACATTDKLTYIELNMETSAVHPAQEIGAGDTKTYVLEFDSTGASSSTDDSIRIDIPDEAETAALGTANDAIEWDDDTEAFNIDGTYIKNLPVNGGTLVF